MVGENPVKRVEKPALAETDPDVHFLETEEVEALLRAVPDDPLGRVERVMYLTAAMTGMRQGELFALRWRDVDWSAAADPCAPQLRPRRVRDAEVEALVPSVPLASRVATELELSPRSHSGSATTTSCSPTRGPASRSTARSCSSASRPRSPVQMFALSGSTT